MASFELESGSLLDRFVVEEIIGRGGMGIVYRIRDPRSRIAYAAKVLNRGLAAERDSVKRFKAEAKAARHLFHTNIVHVFNLKRWNGTYFYIMELVEGRPLDFILEDTRPSFNESLAILRDVAGVLDFIHSRRYVHRDIKPGNVLIRQDGAVKVLDFGLAQKFGRATQTRSGHVMGTAKYMAPELINGLNVSPATDIYALGVMMYELLTGKVPFDADHGNLIMDMHLYVRPKPLTDALPDADKNLSLLIDRMLVKNDHYRAHSAAAIQAWLDFYLHKGFFPDLPTGL